MFEELTPAQEAERLRARFRNVESKAEFARKYGLPGGASMLSQHLSGHRPLRRFFFENFLAMLLTILFSIATLTVIANAIKPMTMAVPPALSSRRGLRPSEAGGGGLQRP